MAQAKRANARSDRGRRNRAALRHPGQSERAKDQLTEHRLAHVLMRNGFSCGVEHQRTRYDSATIQREYRVLIWELNQSKSVER